MTVPVLAACAPLPAVPPSGWPHRSGTLCVQMPRCPIYASGESLGQTLSRGNRGTGRAYLLLGLILQWCASSPASRRVGMYL